MITDTPIKSPIDPKAPRLRRTSSRMETVEEDNKDLSEFSVLIVEDNPINMRMLEACAKKTKCKYNTAFDGQEAIMKYKARQPNGPSIVLLDISLPLMDGFEACKAMRSHTLTLKENKGRVVIPRIVAITALSSPQDIESGLAMGMDEWRVKPAALPKLTADLLRWQKEWQESSLSNETTNEISHT